MTNKEFDNLSKFVKATEGKIDNLNHLKRKLDDLKLNTTSEYITTVFYALQSVSVTFYDSIVNSIIHEISSFIKVKEEIFTNTTMNDIIKEIKVDA